LGRSRSLKVTDFGTDRKPVCNFLLVNNANLCPVSHRFRVISAYWSNCLFWQKCLYLTPSFEVNPWTLHCEIWPQKLKK